MFSQIHLWDRLQNFWQVWQSLGSNPRVVSIVQEGYNLSSKVRPPLTRSSLIVSEYANPLKNSYLTEALHALVQKQAMKKGHDLILAGLQQVEANPRSQLVELVSSVRDLQNGSSRNHKTFPSTRRVHGHFSELQ